MSDSSIILIPEQLGHVPEKSKHDQAVRKFREVAPEVNAIEVKLTEGIRFIHCGQNFGGVFCPGCGRELGLSWWQERMDEDLPDHETGFKLVPKKLPCCEIERTLHQLRYEGTVGFTRFSIEAMNPSIGLLEKARIALFEQILDCPLRVIYCRY